MSLTNLKPHAQRQALLVIGDTLKSAARDWSDDDVELILDVLEYNFFEYITDQSPDFFGTEGWKYRIELE